MDKALISRRFAKAVGTYLDKADVQRYVASRMAELTGRYIPSDIQERVLEIGCGTGMFTRMYLQQAAPEEMWLNDLCPEVEPYLADVLGEKVHFMAKDAETLAFPEGQDLIVSCSAVQWFEDLPRFFSGCRKLLHEGGEHRLGRSHRAGELDVDVVVRDGQQHMDGRGLREESVRRKAEHGTAKPEGYYSIEKMLTEAKRLSGEVIKEAESGTFQLWNECDSLSYFYLFNIDDGDGNIPNFKGKGKSTNKEFIFSQKFDYNLARIGINLSHTVITWQATDISASFGESFPCRNGLPIRISYTGNMSDAQNNPEFAGYDTFVGEFRNRDYRFISCCMSIPDRTIWSSRPEDGRQLTQTGNPYPEALFPKNNEVYDGSDPAYGSPCGIFKPTLRTNATAATYGSRKFLIEGANRPQNTESADYPLIRLAEVHLIYAEATCELNGGTISDEDLNKSINKNRARARVAPLTNALIANVWDAGWFDHATGKTICKKMNMLDEIRRERACELFGEGFRSDDLKRWGIAHINLRGQKLGRHILGTAYETEKANDATYFGEPCYYPEKYPLLYGIYQGSGPNDPDYGRSIATLAGNLLFSQRDYLSPIPLVQIRLNPQLKQNPGW